MNKLDKIHCKATAFLINKLSKQQMVIGGTAFSAFMLAPIAAFADKNTGTAIQDGVSQGANSLWDILKAIVLPIAAVFFAWNAFKAIFGGEHGMEAAKKNMLTIVIVIALVFLAPIAVQQVGQWFDSASEWVFK